MRFFLALASIGLLLLPSLHQWGLLVDYAWDASDYAAHCENTARPELQCNGKCHLMKEMASLPAEPPEFPMVPRWEVLALPVSFDFTAESRFVFRIRFCDLNDRMPQAVEMALSHPPPESKG